MGKRKEERRKKKGKMKGERGGESRKKMWNGKMGREGK